MPKPKDETQVLQEEQIPPVETQTPPVEDPHKIANRIMEQSGCDTVYLATDGQWFTKKESAVRHSDGAEPKEFKLKKEKDATKS